MPTWGDSWGDSWGVSWGSATPVPPTPAPAHPVWLWRKEPLREPVILDVMEQAAVGVAVLMLGNEE